MPKKSIEKPLGFEVLKAKQRAQRAAFPEAVGLRVHRAISWLGRAEAEKTDTDVRFILLWVGFNSAYASDLDATGVSERGSFGAFFDTLVSLDSSIVSTMPFGRASPRKYGSSSLTSMSLPHSGTSKMELKAMTIGKSGWLRARNLSRPRLRHSIPAVFFRRSLTAYTCCATSCYMAAQPGTAPLIAAKSATVPPCSAGFCLYSSTS